jgi:hypothetical protein
VINRVQGLKNQMEVNIMAGFKIVVKGQAITNRGMWARSLPARGVGPPSN